VFLLFRIYESILDDSTLIELKKSKHRSPEITDVVYDINQFQELVLDSINVVEKGFDVIWDKTVFNFHFTYLQDGFKQLETLIEEKHLRVRLIVEATQENINQINSIKYYDVRHIDKLKGNFGILDGRTYMIYFFNQDTEKPEQGFFSNSKVLVDQQQQIFEKLWELAIPISIRSKELKHQESQEFQKMLTDFIEIKNEVYSLIAQSRKDLVIYSSIKILISFIYEDSFWNHYLVLLKRGVNIRILTDDYDSELLRHINEINRTNKNNQIQIGYSKKLGNIEEFIIISDGKALLRINHKNLHNFVASLTNKEHQILVQEILFEKYWNEIKSLAIVDKHDG
jgi:hypothetical protein